MQKQVLQISIQKIYAYTQTYISIDIDKDIYIYMCVCMHTHVHVFVHAWIRIHKTMKIYSWFLHQHAYQGVLK